MAPSKQTPVILFGYDSSPFTNKVRLALRLKGVSFSYIAVPSMLPRPILTNTFALQYRKIPVLAIGREIYCDTSLIIEALEHFFPTEKRFATVYPRCEALGTGGGGEWVYRGVVRGFASFWTDRPLFRTTTGLIPPSVWRSSFGTDRAQLIGHTLDPDKLGPKIPTNLSNLDLHLSLLEPTFKTGTWALPTETPGLADISLYYQLRWGMDISAGKGIYNLTSGATPDTEEDIMSVVFTEDRFPGLWGWFQRFETYLFSLPQCETTVDGNSSQWRRDLMETNLWKDGEMLVPAAVQQHPTLDAQGGLVLGAVVSVAPDDTGRDNATVGTLVGLGVEEVVTRPVEGAQVDVRIHFPRLGFRVKRVEGMGSRL